MEKTKKIDIEDAIEEYGDFSWWHIWTYLLVSLPVCFSGTLDVSIIFLQEVPDHVCRTELCENISGAEDLNAIHEATGPKLSSGKFDSCNRYNVNFGNLNLSSFVDRNLSNIDTIPCYDWSFYPEDGMHKTPVTQWNLLCGRAVHVSNLQTSYVIGRIIGGFIAGTLADVYGRKKMIFPGLLSGSLVAIAAPWIPNLYVFMLSRFLMGFLLSIGLNALFVLTLEYFNENMRKFMAVYWNGYSTGYAVLAGVAYVTRDWRSMHSICAALNVACLPLLYWWCPESPRWCASKDKSEEPRIFLKTVASWNKKEIPQSVLEAEFCTIKPSSEEQSGSSFIPEFYRVMFSHPRILFRTASLWICWFVTSIIYYGVTLLVTSFVGSVFFNNAISGLLEIPSNCLSYPILLWARKKPLAICFFVGGVSCLFYAVIPNVSWAQLLVAFIGKFGATFCFNIIFVYTAELYYTEIRTSAVSFGAIGMNFAGVVAPYIVLIAYKNSALTFVPMLIFGGFGILATVCMLFLPETQDQMLPENLEDILHYPPKKHGPLGDTKPKSKEKELDKTTSL